ncbi:hypothetical protein [Lundtoftevirus Lu221]|uniref:Uncharacterized protein n=1 Tax=phage PKM.Lu.22.1 TaxID=3049197 RepID=A0AAF0RCY7_9CAUD|nr:hypothetical protein [phage PKM.Lu.22.1]
MNFVTDPKLLEELNAGFNPQGASAPSVDSQTQTAPQEAETNWGIYAKEDGSIMDTIGSGLTRMGRATAAAMVPSDDEDMSDYALARARRANAEYKADAEKLGVAGQVVAGAATYAPVIAAGIANPLAGAAMMGGATTADSLAAQIDNNQDLDLNSAIAAGAASAGVDLATMGLASRGMNVAKELTSPVKRAIAGTGIQATQGATSNAAAQAAINLASGRPWNEGLTEAAAIGGVAGGGLHATLSGLNHSTGTPPNKGGQKATEDQVKFETKDGITPTGDYRNQVYEYANQRHQYDEDINNIDIDDTNGLDAAVNAKVGMALNNGTASAIQGTAKLLDKFKVPKTINFWDMDVGNGINSQPVGNIARDWFNFSDKDLLKAGESIGRAKQTLTGRTKALEQGEFEESFLRQMKDSYDKAQNDILGRAESNWRTVDNIRSQMTGAERPMRDSLNILSRNLEDYSKMVRDANLGKAPNTDALRAVVESIEVNAKKTGLRDKLKSLVDDGEQFDGITNLESALLFAKGSQKVAPGIHRANPDPLKASSQKADMLDAAAVATGQFWLPIARRGLREIGGKRSQARLRGEKAQGEVVSQSLARDPRPDFVNQAAQRGDFKGAADEAAADLESMGISTGQKDVWGREAEAAPVQETAPIQEAPVTPEPEVDVWGRPREFTDLTGRGVREAEAAKAEAEAANAPVVDPEAEAQIRFNLGERLAQDARVDAQRRAPAPEPEPAFTDKDSRRVDDLQTKQNTDGLTSSEARELESLTQRKPKPEVKEAEPEAPKKEGVKASELARKPISDKIKEFKELSPEAKKDPQLINEFTRNRRLLSDADKAVSSKATAMSVPQEDIWRIIERQGGLESVFKDGHSAERGLNILMQKDKIDLQRKADIEAKNAEDAADSVNTESGKGETTSTDEVDTGKVIEDMKKDFISKGVSGETFEAAQVRAEQTLGPDYTPTQLANVVKLLAKEKAAKAREEAKKTSKAAKTSTPAATPTVGRTMQDSWNDIHGYAQTLGVDAEPEIRKALKSAMNSGNKDRAKFKALSEAKERELYNKVDDFIAEQQKAYERALAAPKTEQPAELGEWRKKVADLKKRRARVSNFNDWQTKKADARKAIAEKAIKEEEARTKRLEAEAKKADDEAKAAEKAIKDAEEAKAAEQKKMEEAVEKAFEEKDMDADVIVEAGSQLFEKLAARVNSTDSPDYNKLKAIMTVVERNLPVTKLKTGERNQAKALLLSQKALFDGLARKAEFPNNPEYWLSTTERDLIGEAYTGKQGTKEYGSMYQRLRAGLFEDESTREYVRFPIEALNRKIKNLRKRAENTTELGEGAINVQDIK